MLSRVNNKLPKNLGLLYSHFKKMYHLILSSEIFFVLFMSASKKLKIETFVIALIKKKVFGFKD